MLCNSLAKYYGISLRTRRLDTKFVTVILDSIISSLQRKNKISKSVKIHLSLLEHVSWQLNWVFPKYFHCIQWHFCKKGYLNLQPLVLETRMFPQGQQDTGQREEDLWIHASVIFQIRWISWIHWISLPYRENWSEFTAGRKLCTNLASKHEEVSDAVRFPSFLNLCINWKLKKSGLWHDEYFKRACVIHRFVPFYFNMTVTPYILREAIQNIIL